MHHTRTPLLKMMSNRVGGPCSSRVNTQASQYLDIHNNIHFFCTIKG